MKPMAGNKWVPERNEINLKTSGMRWKMFESDVKLVMRAQWS